MFGSNVKRLGLPTPKKYGQTAVSQYSKSLGWTATLLLSKRRNDGWTWEGERLCDQLYGRS